MMATPSTSPCLFKRSADSHDRSLSNEGDSAVKMAEMATIQETGPGMRASTFLLGPCTAQPW